MTKKTLLTLVSVLTLLTIVVVGIVIQLTTPNFIEWTARDKNGNEIHLASQKIYPDVMNKKSVIDIPGKGDMTLDDSSDGYYQAKAVAYRMTENHTKGLTIEKKNVDRGSTTIDNNFRQLSLNKDDSVVITGLPNVPVPEKSLIDKYVDGDYIAKNN